MSGHRFLLRNHKAPALVSVAVREAMGLRPVKIMRWFPFNRPGYFYITGIINPDV